MSEELYELSGQILLEIESIQNRLNFSISLAKQLDDQQFIEGLGNIQRELSTARETLMSKMRSANA